MKLLSARASVSVNVSLTLGLNYNTEDSCLLISCEVAEQEHWFLHDTTAFSKSRFCECSKAATGENTTCCVHKLTTTNRALLQYICSIPLQLHFWVTYLPKSITPMQLTCC